MTPIARTTHLLLAAAFIAVPGAALARDNVVAQANVVADKAEDLRAATDKLNNRVAAERDDQAALDNNGAYADGDADGDGDRHGRHHDGEDHGKWGLLGLLGLAGLLGLRRRDDHVHHDTHRHDVRDPDMTTSTTASRTRSGGLDSDPTTRL